MDVDNMETNTSNANMDVEQSLLQQFSCMGTTDHDELVQQLQKLLGPQLNYSTAVFFLDMNNWNLQAAVGSYFDISKPTKIPSMAVAPDLLCGELWNIEPNVCFEKNWRIYNNGTEAWPTDCYLQFAGGTDLGCQRVGVPSLLPGEEMNLTVRLNSPSQPRLYQSKFRLCTPTGSYFGDTMWVIFTVVERGTVELTHQLSRFSDLGGPPPVIATRNPFTTTVRSHSTDTTNTQETPPQNETSW